MLTVSNLAVFFLKSSLKSLIRSSHLSFFYHENKLVTLNRYVCHSLDFQMKQSADLVACPCCLQQVPTGSCVFTSLKVGALSLLGFNQCLVSEEPPGWPPLCVSECVKAVCNCVISPSVPAHMGASRSLTEVLT